MYVYVALPIYTSGCVVNGLETMVAHYYTSVRIQRAQTLKCAPAHRASYDTGLIKLHGFFIFSHIHISLPTLRTAKVDCSHDEHCDVHS